MQQAPQAVGILLWGAQISPCVSVFSLLVFFFCIKESGGAATWRTCSRGPSLLLVTALNPIKLLSLTFFFAPKSRRSHFSAISSVFISFWKGNNICLKENHCGNFLFGAVQVAVRHSLRRHAHTTTPLYHNNRHNGGQATSYYDASHGHTGHLPGSSSGRRPRYRILQVTTPNGRTTSAAGGRRIITIIILLATPTRYQHARGRRAGRRAATYIHKDARAVAGAGKHQDSRGRELGGVVGHETVGPWVRVAGCGCGRHYARDEPGVKRRETGAFQKESERENWGNSICSEACLVFVSDESGRPLRAASVKGWNEGYPGLMGKRWRGR